MTLDQALVLVRAAGYRVTKPKPKKTRTVGPTFEAIWSDGIVTRMSIHTVDDDLDVARAVSVSRAAYESRTKRNGAGRIVKGRFCRGDTTLAEYGAMQLGAAA